MSPRLPIWKRLFDIFFALFLALLLSPVLIGVALWILLRDGRPVFYVSERMRTEKLPFWLWKFRTMQPDAEDRGVTGQDKDTRITATGQFLRRSRLDELPQLLNILRGDMSFVGPRPPLRRYVELYPDLYAKVLQNRPGVTGLATAVFHQHEERILATSTSAEETEALYCRRCVPRKARLDLIYQAHLSLWLDLYVLKRTLKK